MTSEIIVALIACMGTIVGSFFGVMASNKNTTWRISQLEEKVNKHNNLIERMYQVEGKVQGLEHSLESDENRLDTLESFHMEG